MGRAVPLLMGLVVCAAMVGSSTQFENGEMSDNAHPSERGGWVYPLGDPRLCLERAAQSGKNMQVFEVLPGYGWDNLQNLGEGQVVSFNYSQCRTTEDGRFLLPDTVSAVPIKSSLVQTFAELIMHWRNWTSTTSRSINMGAGLSLTHVGISGKFSSDYEDIKSKQIGDKSVTTRTQLRYIRYGVHLQPDTPLHPVFKERVLDIAAAEELGEKDQAQYLAQLLVRDFGTHVVTKAKAGASLELVDQLREDWVLSQMEHKSDILAAASASLFNILHISFSDEKKTDEKFVDDFRKSRTSSNIVSIGGPLFKPTNFTPNMWASEVDNDLVPIDRSGDPIFYVLTRATLPELPSSTLNEVYKTVKKAVETYYSYNVIPGCLDPKSPNFSPSANMEDNTCTPPPTNLTFGGVYQTCRMERGSNNGDLCGNLHQENPQTGTFSCPGNYLPIKLHTGKTSTSRTQHRCERYMLFWHKCYDDYYKSEAVYELNWCVATTSVPSDSGYLFGGLFTSKVVNPVTRAASCPPAFFPLVVAAGGDLHICISDDFEFGAQYSLPFAGFISCQAGNPLAVSDGPNPGPPKKGAQSDPKPYAGKLKSFFKDQADDWPMRCPEGYSRHLATVDQGCEISYCVRTGSMVGPILPPIKRPPFIDAPPISAPLSHNAVIFDPYTHTWKRDQKAIQEMSDHEKSSNGSLSPGAAAGISFGATLGCIILATLAMLAVRARRRKGKIASGYRQLQNPLVESQQDYGSVNSVRPRPASTAVILGDESAE